MTAKDDSVWIVVHIARVFYNTSVYEKEQLGTEKVLIVT